MRLVAVGIALGLAGAAAVLRILMIVNADSDAAVLPRVW